MAKFDTLIENWDTIDTDIWHPEMTSGNSPLPVAVDNTLDFSVSPGQAGQSDIYTNAFYDITDSYVTFQIIDAGDNGGEAPDNLNLSLFLIQISGEVAFYQLNFSNFIGSGLHIAGPNSVSCDLPADSTPYVAVVESSGDILFMTSVTGAPGSWTTQFTTPSAFTSAGQILQIITLGESVDTAKHVTLGPINTVNPLGSETTPVHSDAVLSWDIAYEPNIRVPGILVLPGERP